MATNDVTKTSESANAKPAQQSRTTKPMGTICTGDSDRNRYNFSPYLQDGRKPRSDSDCFVATACYGSPSAPEVVELRSFRDSCMIRTVYGRALVTLYYAISPGLAAFVGERPWLSRSLRCLVLAPIVRLVRYHGTITHREAN